MECMVFIRLYIISTHSIQFKVCLESSSNMASVQVMMQSVSFSPWRLFHIIGLPLKLPISSPCDRECWRSSVSLLNPINGRISSRRRCRHRVEPPPPNHTSTGLQVMHCFSELSHQVLHYFLYRQSFHFWFDHKIWKLLIHNLLTLII